MSDNNQPVEVQAREAISIRAASCIVWEKQNAANTSAVRKSSFCYMMEAARAAGTLMDEEISTVCSSFAVKLVEGGIKKDTVKVRKSELRRILEHINLVPEDASGWNAAIKSIKNATMDSLELARDDVEQALRTIQKAHESLNATVAQYQDLLNENRPKGTAAYSIEQAAQMIKDAIAAKNASANVSPINVASLFATPAAAQATSARAISKDGKASAAI